jgi:hypothetical protein
MKLQIKKNKFKEKESARKDNHDLTSHTEKSDNFSEKTVKTDKIDDLKSSNFEKETNLNNLQFNQEDLVLDFHTNTSIVESSPIKESISPEKVKEIKTLLPNNNSKREIIDSESEEEDFSNTKVRLAKR